MPRDSATVSNNMRKIHSKDTAIEDTDAWRTDGSYDSVYNGIRVSSEMKEKVKKQETEKEIKLSIVLGK